MTVIWESSVLIKLTTHVYNIERKIFWIYTGTFRTGKKRLNKGAVI